MDNEKEQILKNKLISILDEITYAVADQIISQSSVVFKATTEARKILNSQSNTEYTYAKFKWTQYGMLEHSLKVAELILKEKKSFPEACNLRAKEVHKTVPSIRQACCRALGLNSDHWNKMSKGDPIAKSLIINKLTEKYSNEREKIVKVFFSNK